jgi:non-specific serine/threonine protein kinase/serine/threonine-protein kinase
MSLERWERVRELFHRAVDLPPGERTAFLNVECPDGDIRAEVETLLGDDRSGPLDSPVVEGRREAIRGQIADESSGGNHSGLTEPLLGAGEGRRIGRYRLMQKIGDGGMGEVWLADQKEPVRRRVALKLVKAGMNTAEVMSRFESARQALALMDQELLLRVCEGVQHVHQKAIIHRDPKPSNILATEVGGKAAPKIIDLEWPKR